MTTIMITVIDKDGGEHNEEVTKKTLSPLIQEAMIHYDQVIVTVTDEIISKETTYSKLDKGWVYEVTKIESMIVPWVPKPYPVEEMWEKAMHSNQ